MKILLFPQLYSEVYPFFLIFSLFPSPLVPHLLTVIVTQYQLTAFHQRKQLGSTAFVEK